MIQKFLGKLTPQEKKIFYLAMAFVLVAFFDRLFLGPALSRLSSLEDEIEEQKNVIKRDLRFLLYKDKIIKENMDFSIYYSAGQKTEEEIIAAFLKDIEILASEAKVNLIKVNPSDSRQKRGYVEYYANLECDGTLENVTRFMYLIDTSPTLLKITQVNINPKRASAEEVAVTLAVKKVIVGAFSASEIQNITQEISTEDMTQSGDQGSAGGMGGSGAGGTGDASGSAGGAGGPGQGSGAGKSKGAGGGQVQGDAMTNGKEGPAQKTSERFRPKKDNESKEKKPSKDELEHEIKPSIFERILQKKAPE
ncbi:MAG: type 4a pilus biogenesis protein PilO [Candidatus Omnitrophota bacterium]